MKSRSYTLGKAQDAFESYDNRCRGKHVYPSKRQANGMRRALVAKGHAGATLNAYRCRDCRHWHLGNVYARRRPPVGATV